MNSCLRKNCACSLANVASCCAETFVRPYSSVHSSTKFCTFHSLIFSKNCDRFFLNIYPHCALIFTDFQYVHICDALCFEMVPFLPCYFGSNCNNLPPVGSYSNKTHVTSKGNSSTKLFDLKNKRVQGNGNKQEECFNNITKLRRGWRSQKKPLLLKKTRVQGPKMKHFYRCE